jgi:hypothetical protein
MRSNFLCKGQGFCAALLITVYIAIISTLLSCHGSSESLLCMKSAQSSPMADPKIILVGNHRIHDIKTAVVEEVISFRRRDRVTDRDSCGTHFAATKSLFGRLVRENQSRGKYIVASRVVQRWSVAVFNYFHRRINYDVPRRCLPSVDYVHLAANHPFGFEIISCYRDCHPWSLILPHYAELASQDDELIDGGHGQHESKYGYALIGEKTSAEMMFEPFPSRWMFIFGGFACGLCGGFFLIFGQFLLFHDECTSGGLLCLFLGAFLFALVFAFGHAAFNGTFVLPKIPDQYLTRTFHG